MILSKFVFPYKAEDAIRDLINLYENTIASQINILKGLILKKKIAVIDYIEILMQNNRVKIVELK